MYDFKFNLLDNVKILPLENILGQIISIWIGINDIQYNVRYFVNSKVETVYFYHWELEKVTKTYE